ncbi:MAG: RagB/SusD family nutrient uptake outer membrane protein [Niabella sp.]|nr:RagB/SusD family nutrient uptake outer membrane protein [Niabella sp.]
MKNLNTFIALLFVGLGFVSCKKGLDYQNTNAINPGNVWTDSVMIKAYINDIYGGSMPGWPIGSGSGSDEGVSGSGVNLSNYLQGILDPASNFTNLGYTYIDKTNYFLDQMATVPTTVLSAGLKAQLTGEAKFWRAWAYWGMVSQIGGVPLILHTQDPTNPASLKVPRSKTSDCVAQILKDLDSAALVLPASFSGNDYGRITSVAAKGLKGRILMWYASPLFNPSNDQARWQAAYAATLDAVNAANAGGYGLLSNYRAIWYSANKEQIMVNQYYYPDHYMNFNGIRPLPFTNGNTNVDQPVLSLLLAYPKRDGSPMQFDRNQLSNTAYNAQFLTDFYTNRDDRFYATIWCGGTVYPTPDVNTLGMTVPRSFSYWDAWTWKAASTPSSIVPMRTAAYQGISPLIQNGDEGGVTGFFERKGLDTTLDRNQLVQVASGAKSWWSPMRYAELLLNYAECANELGKSSEALGVLYQIRQRANISAGAGNNYGVTASSQADLRTAIINERQVELAYEGFRFGDLRRWRRYDILNNQGTRKAMLLMLNKGAALPANTDNIMTATVRANFSAVLLDNVDQNTSANQKYALDLNHWFFALNPAQISQEPDMLPQNKEWGGSFDPLQ